jgi:hypothetical protein
MEQPSSAKATPADIIAVRKTIEVKRAQNTIDPPGSFILSFGLSYHMILAYTNAFVRIVHIYCSTIGRSRSDQHERSLARRQTEPGQAGRGAALWQRNNRETPPQPAHKPSQHAGSTAFLDFLSAAPPTRVYDCLLVRLTPVRPRELRVRLRFDALPLNFQETIKFHGIMDALLKTAHVRQDIN